eukprot:scaffold7641_cov115-Cylindrotheca_fusiformis.AAC.24
MFHAAKITRKHLASPTVMILELAVPTLASFDPGQWVDFVAPPHDWIGGFSIASPPSDLPHLILAVKRSRAPASSWVHSGEAKEGTDVRIQVGGNCTLSEKDYHHPVVFCAGGIGISPVLGNYRAFLAYHEKNGTLPNSMFLYSIATQDEFIFGNELMNLFHCQHDATHKSRMVCTLTKSSKWTHIENGNSTSGAEDNESKSRVEFRVGRYLHEFLNATPKESIFYICGPAAMNDDAASYLEANGVPSASIRYEKWW